MVLKNRRVKTLVAALAIFSVVSTGASSYVFADDNISNSNISIVRTFTEGKHTVSNKVVYVNADGVAEPDNEEGAKHARMVLNDTSIVTIKDGKIYLTVSYAEKMHSMMTNYKFKVDGKNVDYTQDGASYTFELNKIDSVVEAGVTVPMMASKDVKFQIVIDKAQVPTKPEDTNKPEDTTKPEDSNNSEAGNGSNVSNSTIKDGTYTVKNNVSYTGTGNAEIGNSMARQVLEEKSTIVVKNGKIRTTLTFAEEQYSFLENFRITVDGKSVSLEQNKNNRTVSFDMPSIDSEVIVQVKVSIMGRDVSFKTTFDKSSINQGNSGTTGGTGSNGSNTNNSNQNTGTTGGTTTETTNSVKKGKLYTIKNTVSHQSEVGQSMARKYLNSTSKVEIIDGKTYVTLTFTGSGYMKNHAIYVNGSKVSHQVTSKSGDTISLRFKVSSLKDSIKVGMYVVPMSRNIDFKVGLLENTLTFVKGYEVSGENSTLPQTGSALDSSMIASSGAALMAIGGILQRRKRK